MHTGPIRRNRDRWLATSLVICGSSGVILLVLHSVANAITRKLLDYPLPGTTVYGGMWYLPVIAFFGFIIAQKHGKHIEVRLLFDRVPAVMQKDLAVFGYVVTLAMLGVMTWTTLTEALHNAEISLTAGVTGVVIWPITFLPPICFTALVVQNVFGLVRVLLGNRSAVPRGETEASNASA